MSAIKARAWLQILSLRYRFPVKSSKSKVLNLSLLLSPGAVPALPMASGQASNGHLDQDSTLSAALLQITSTLAAVVASLKAVPAGPVAGDVQTVGEVVNEFLVSKARAGRSDRYLRQVRTVLVSFSSGRHKTPLSLVSVQEIEKWLNSHNWSRRTMKGYLGDVRTLYSFALRRGYIAHHTARGAELPAGGQVAGPGPAPAIHTPGQVQAVLEGARAFSLDVCRMLAIRYFAGVRSAEVHRLREENILPGGYIEVPAAKSKTRRRRLIKIQPNLSAWLALGGELRPIRPDTVRAGIRSSGVNWPPNVTRHSFCSYHLAKFQSAGKTAIEAGHTEAMLFNHYRELVTPEAAEKFWSILPAAV